VFKLTAQGVESIVWDFGGRPDGSLPLTGLLADKSGNLYGTTQYGGVYGYGTVFKLSAHREESVLWSFGKPGTSDGASPDSLIMDSSGNLYGTTGLGGAHGASGGGTVFKLPQQGIESVLRNFGGAYGGTSPSGPL